MSDAPAQAQEPSIEEILASIRRIISEDGEEEGGEAAEAAAAETPAPAQAQAEEPMDDVLELTERIDEPAPAFEERSPRVAAEEPMPPRNEDYADDGLVSAPIAQKASDVMSRIAPREADRTADPLPIAHRTLEEVVREMMRPMLREWLDTYLPAIVERSVERELRRMSRRAEELH